MIVPPGTTLPSCAFTPSRWEFESRPLRELPCPFLCAMASDQNVRDSDLRGDGAVPLGPAHPLAAFFLEHPDFRAALFAVDDGRDARVGDEWRAGENLAAILFDEQHLVNRHLGAGLGDCAGDRGDPTLGDLDLMPAALHDCVH